MCDKCATYIPVIILIVDSGFGDAVGCVESDISDDTQKITSLGGCLMLNDAAVCGGRVRLNIFVMVWSDMWK